MFSEVNSMLYFWLNWSQPRHGMSSTCKVYSAALGILPESGPGGEQRTLWKCGREPLLQFKKWCFSSTYHGTRIILGHKNLFLLWPMDRALGQKSGPVVVVSASFVPYKLHPDIVDLCSFVEWQTAEVKGMTNCILSLSKRFHHFVLIVLG